MLRTALALAVACGRPVRLTGVRARRPRPGLQPQHLTVVRALATISGAAVEGDALGSTEVRFAPGAVSPGDYCFDVEAIRGSAGSVSLLFQALLLPLALAHGASHLVLRGGTHVPWSPPVHYLGAVFLPAVREVGVEARLELRRWGWYPAGGGEIEAWIEPGAGLRGLRLEAPPTALRVRGLSAVSRLPRSIAERQRARALERLAGEGIDPDIAVEEDTRARGPGTLLFLGVHGRAGFSALGRRGVPAERVADEAVGALLAWRAGGGVVDEHLADQLVGFLALAPHPSVFTCASVSSHLRTVAWLVEQLVPVNVTLGEGRPARIEVVPQPAHPGGSHHEGQGQGPAQARGGGQAGAGPHPAPARAPQAADEAPSPSGAPPRA